MSTRYELTFEVPPEMLQRAMTAWAKPTRKTRNAWVFLVICLCVGAVLGVLGNITGLFDLVSAEATLGALIGFYVALVLWWLVARSQAGKIVAMSQLQLRKQGPITGVYEASGVTVSSALSTTQSVWAVYDQVIMMDDATALRSGGVIYPIPHAALPAEVDPVTFRADLTRWQEAGQ